MFHRKGFSPKSFLAKSWRLTGGPTEPPGQPTVYPGRSVAAPRKRRRRDRDDDVLLFLLR